MSLIFLILNIALILVCSTCVLACLQLRSKTAYLIAAYVVSFADIVLVLEMAGLLSAIRAAPVLALQMLLTGGSVLVWFRMRRPPLLDPFAGFRLPRPNLRSLLSAFRQSPLSTSLVLLLAASVGYTYVLHARLILAVFPDSYDALTYHLSRVGYWLQYHSFYPWPTPNPRQTTFPMNAELGVLWTILWWGTDRLAGFVQWTTVPAIVLGLYGLARLLGYSGRRALLVALLWPTLTQVLYQSSTAQNDLLTTSFWVATLYFLFAGLHEGKERLLLLSGLAFGLAVGAKDTSLMVLPGLAVALLALLLMYLGRPGLRHRLFIWTAASLLGFALFGAFTYVQNTVAFGDPLGPQTSRTGAEVLNPEGGILTYVSRLRDNLGRYAYQVVDFSPLPFGLAPRINPIKATFFNEIFQRLRIFISNPATISPAMQLDGFGLSYINPLDENGSWFGPLTALLAAAVVVQAYVGARSRDVFRLALGIIGICFLLVQSATQPWTPFRGRYYLIPVALCFPLMACLLSTRTLLRAALTCFVVILALIVMFTVTLQDDALQNATWSAAFAGPRSAPSWTNEMDYRMVLEDVPTGGSIGVVSNDDFRDYPFFGEHFTRRVTLAIPDDGSILPRGDLGRYVSDFRSSDFLFIVGMKSHFIQDLASNAYDLMSVYDGNSIWIRKDLRSSSECDDQKWPFTDFYQSSSSEVCARFPLVRPKVAPRFVQISFLRTGRYVPVIGVGSGGRFEFSLLVKEPTTARLGMQVAPLGAGSQALQLVLSAKGSEPMIFSGSFDTPQVLEYDVRLQPALYTVQLGLADGEGASIQRFQVTTP